MHDFTVPNMLHGRVIRPPAIGAALLSVDESSVAHLPNVKVVRVKNFLGVVAEDEWTCVRAMRELKTRWSDGQGLPDQADLIRTLRSGPFLPEETIVKKGDASAQAPTDAVALKASYYWTIQTHGSIGPSCAIADVASDRATIWTASQGTHGNRNSFARFLGLPQDKVRLIYLDGAGCYGMNGHEDAAADAAAARCACNGCARTSTAGIPRARRNCSILRPPWTTRAVSCIGAPTCCCRRPRRAYRLLRCSAPPKPALISRPASAPARYSRTAIRLMPRRA
jgi:hypothetical protein